MNMLLIDKAVNISGKYFIHDYGAISIVMKVVRFDKNKL